MPGATDHRDMFHPRGQENAPPVPPRPGPMGGNTSPVNVVPGENLDEVALGLAELTAEGWQLDSANMGLEILYRFSSHSKAIDFVLMVNLESKIWGHFPEIHFAHRHVYVHWTTYMPRGLSMKDIGLALHSGQSARALGAVHEGDIREWRQAHLDPL